MALGDACSALRDAQRATDAYRRALLVSPGFAVAAYQLSLCLLGQGYFAEGWKLYESRFDPAIPGAVTPPMMPIPMWEGEDLSGRKLLVLTEQGYGDHIQFCRFVPLLARQGVEIVFGASPEMRELTATLKGVARVVTEVEGAWQSGCDCWTYVASLPYRLGVSAGRVPAKVPYLRADAQRARVWYERLAQSGARLKVGLCWAGRPTHGNDWRRSIPLGLCAPLSTVRDIEFVSLQTGERGRGLAELPEGLQLAPWGAELRDFADTAALLSQLDLLVSIDSSPAHLAGALGRPVWTLLPFQPDWRWRLDDERSRWYPTMRLFRQRRPGDWQEVMERVAAALESFASAKESA